MPMELVQSLGKMHTTYFMSFESATNHIAARATWNSQATPPSHPVFVELARFICDEFVTTPPYTNASHVNDAQSHVTVRTPHTDTINDLQMDFFFLEPSMQLRSDVSLNMSLRSPFPTCRFLPKSISKSIPALTTQNLATFLLKRLPHPQWDSNGVNLLQPPCICARTRHCLGRSVHVILITSKAWCNLQPQSSKPTTSTSWQRFEHRPRLPSLQQSLWEGSTSILLPKASTCSFVTSSCI